MIKIESIYINNINSISCLTLNFKTGVNILCGTNGIGKTTILNCINQFSRNFSPRVSLIRTKMDTEKSAISLTVNSDGQVENYDYQIPKIDNEENANRLVHRKKIIYFNISQRQQVGTLPLTIGQEGRESIRSSYDAMKSWFYRNYFKKTDVIENKLKNFNLSKRIFSKLDPNVYFEAANEKDVFNEFTNRPIKTVEILLKTQYGTIDMDSFSSGYKACFNILFGIVRNIEHRLSMSVEDFDGIVLIDEIDLHLHPEWQTKIIDILKWLIPNAQIIITTHSPHVIQNADQGEIIPLGLDEEGKIYVRELPESSEYGYQGWTIEEILQDVMGLKNTHSELYYHILKEFDEALDNLDIKKATESYNEIDKLLHPANHLRKVFKIQLGSLGGLEID
ncbi:AAA family ATPase [Bacillus sp. NTK034]|uniref:AAA family ATPase n=1 Tax=Bacillus sp. NTK034 TaxID=2802176 RepID=UPI001A8ED13E|nr:ATP-binding protein [Bacillus sp. NTK034]MBN8203484.1 AAA family ATPase [Bacillus sp. NTK034]